MSVTSKTLELWGKYEEKIPETMERLKNKEPISHIVKDFGFYKDGFVDYLEKKGLYQKRAWAKKPRIDMKLLTQARDLYINEKKNISEIAELLNLNRKALSKDLKLAFNMEIRQDGKKELNDNYFEEIDTPEKAYWLGFLCADGCNREEKHSIEFSQQIKDEERVLAFKKAINSGHKLQHRNVYLPITGKEYPQCRISFKSKKMSEDLAKWGCVSNKTYCIEFPKFLSEILMSHFVRGFFDGDGCIFCNELYRGGSVQFTSASKPFLKDFQTHLYSIGICSKILKVKDKENWSLHIERKNQLSKFFSYMYNETNDSIRMTRKFKKFDVYLQKNHCRPELKTV